MPRKDLLAPKREHLAQLMNAALDASFEQGMDPQAVEWKLQRKRDQRFSADMPEMRCLDEGYLDFLIGYYGSSGYVY